MAIKIIIVKSDDVVTHQAEIDAVLLANKPTMTPDKYKSTEITTDKNGRLVTAITWDDGT